MISNVEKVIVGMQHRLKPWSSLCILIASRKCDYSISSLIVRKGKGLPQRYYSSSSTSYVGDDRRDVGDRVSAVDKKKKKPILEQYDIFSQGDDPSAKKKTTVQGYGDTCFEVIIQQSYFLLFVYDVCTVYVICIGKVS